MLGKRRHILAAGLSVTAIGLYTLLVGAEAAVVRAALMGTLALFARQVGRQQNGLNSLGQVAIPIDTAEADQALNLGEGARLEVLAASRSGAILLLEWRSFRTLLPVGLDEDLSHSLLEEPEAIPVTALMLANNGAAEPNPPEWLQAWDAQVMLLSVGSGDRRARPAPEALKAA